MKEIAYRDWYRYEHSQFMARLPSPFIQVQADIDVTAYRDHVKRRGISFYFGLIWLVTKVIEAREDFRWRKRGDRMVLIDSPEPSFTDMAPGGELYKIIHAGRIGEDMAEYAARARAVSDAQQAFFPTDSEEARDDYTYFSCTPHVTFTQLTQAINPDPENFIPAIAWSKYFQRDGRLILPIAIACNHRQADGLQLARLYRDVQAAVDGLRG